MYSYEDRIRAVKLYIKLDKRIAATLIQLGYPTKNASKTGGRRRMTGCWAKGLGLKRRRACRWWVVVRG